MDDNYTKQLEDQLERMAEELANAHRYEDGIEQIVEYLERRIEKANENHGDGFFNEQSVTGRKFESMLKDILIIIDVNVNGNSVRNKET